MLVEFETRLDKRGRPQAVGMLAPCPGPSMPAPLGTAFVIWKTTRFAFIRYACGESEPPQIPLYIFGHSVGAS
jgi:hypothetical protein